jgi:hypothetical protein
MPNTKLVTTIFANGEKVVQEQNLETSPSGINVLVHQQGIRVDLPEMVEINPQDTINCLAGMHEAHWHYITTGELFQVLWHLAMRGELQIPKTLEEMRLADMGMQHVAGLIILGCEAMMQGKSTFFRNPETYLHPKTEQVIMTMFIAMMRMFNHTGEVKKGKKGGGPVSKKRMNKQARHKATADDAPEVDDDEEIDDPDAAMMLKEDSTYADRVIKEAVKEIQKKQPKVDPEEQDREMTLKWLEASAQIKGENADFCRIGDNTYTIAQCIANVKENTSLGRKLADIYLKREPKEPNK